MIELRTTKKPEGEEEQPPKDIPMVEIFSIDGETYSIPDIQRPAVAYQYLMYIREYGVGWAESWLAEELLGKEALVALLNYKEFSHEIMDQVMTAARDIVFGRRPKAQNMKPNGNGSARRAKTQSKTTRRVNGS